MVRIGWNFLPPPFRLQIDTPIICTKIQMALKPSKVDSSHEYLPHTEAIDPLMTGIMNFTAPDGRKVSLTRSGMMKTDRN